MRFKLNYKNIIIYIIPIAFIIWSLFLTYINGYFFLFNIDPEYPYLINGLNISVLDFSRIGHTDHPGTPFQIITAIFLRITHLVAGRGNIIDDVIARPEMYLSCLSFYLTFITSIILFWLGKIVYKLSGNIVGVIIIQSSLFLNFILMDVLTRYIPDRLLVIIVLLFIGIIYKYFYDKNYSSIRFSIVSGLLMGIAVMTKINFFPILIVSLIILRNNKDRLIYIGAFSITAFTLFLPIIKRHYIFRNFLTRILFHDGLYGKGTE